MDDRPEWQLMMKAWYSMAAGLALASRTRSIMSRHKSKLKLTRSGRTTWAENSHRSVRPAPQKHPAGPGDCQVRTNEDPTVKMLLQRKIKCIRKEVTHYASQIKKAIIPARFSFVLALLVAVLVVFPIWTKASAEIDAIYWTLILFGASMALGAFVYFFLISSWVAFSCTTSKSNWKTSYGIGKMKTLGIAVASVYPCISAPLSLGLKKLNVSFTIIITAILLIEVVTVLYACLDLYSGTSLRWFLRTLPYCVTSGVFLLSAEFQVNSEGKLFPDDNSLANAVMSFVTFTYFIQVFNERFCKKQDDCPEAQEQCRPMSAREGFIMMRACDKIKNAMEQLYLANKTNDYILVNPSFVKFSCPTDKPVKHGTSNRPGADDTEGILLYDPKTKQYLGYFPEDPVQDRKPSLLPCPNGAERDMTGQEHPAPAPAEAMDGTCTIIGQVENH